MPAEKSGQAEFQFEYGEPPQNMHRTDPGRNELYAHRNCHGSRRGMQVRV
jgi:hypothetical protein